VFRSEQGDRTLMGRRFAANQRTGQKWHPGHRNRRQPTAIAHHDWLTASPNRPCFLCLSRELPALGGEVRWQHALLLRHDYAVLNVFLKFRSSPAFYCPSNIVLPFNFSTTRAAALGRHESIPLRFLPLGCFLLFGRLCQTNNG
jgi:hypothetical protein